MSDRTNDGYPAPPTAQPDGNGDPQPPDAKRPRLALSKEKLHTLHGAVRTKTAFQRQKEEMEERQRKEEEERAKVFSEFVSSFDDDPTAASHDKTFVRSSKAMTGRNHDDRDRIFRPLAPPPLQRPGAAAANPSIAPPSAEKDYQPEAPMISNPLRKRKLDELVESFKQKSDSGPSSARSDPQHAAASLGALHLPFSSVSTNVFVGNLNPAVTEDVLCSLFAPFGPIASIKIMWPRTKEELSRGHHSGFVCFMDRSSAQRAFSTMQGHTLQGFPMRLDWGKPVTLPATPFYVSAEHADSTSPSTSSTSDPTSYQITIPDDPLVLTLIHQTIQRVLTHGSAFESLVLAKNKDNPTFTFLTDTRHPHHLYYKWRTYSLLQGDSTTRWSTAPFRIHASDPIEWIPPPCLAALDDEDPLAGPAPPDSDDDVVRGGQAAGCRSARLGVVRRLRALCYRSLGVPRADAGQVHQQHPTRAMVARVAALCIAASDAAADMSAELARMVTGPASTSAAAAASAVGRWQLHLLYVLHDVVVNSTAPVPNAWRYREAIQAELPGVFDALGATYAQMRSEAGGQSRWAADAWRAKVLAVASCWRIGMVYPREYVGELEARFKGPWAAVQAAAAAAESAVAGDQVEKEGVKEGDGAGKAAGEMVKAASGTTANWVAVGSAGAGEDEPEESGTVGSGTAPPPSRPKAGGLAFSLGRR